MKTTQIGPLCKFVYKIIFYERVMFAIVGEKTVKVFDILSV